MRGRAVSRLASLALRARGAQKAGGLASLRCLPGAVQSLETCHFSLASGLPGSVGQPSGARSFASQVDTDNVTVFYPEVEVEVSGN